MAGEERTLRELKKERTRAALIDAGRRLFEERGYERTTVADIAAEAQIGTRTFFAYFESKEQLLFPESDARVEAALAAIATKRPGETPAEVLLRGFVRATAADDEIVSPLARLRMRLVREVPAVQGRALRAQLEAQRAIARALREAFAELDEVSAMALVGAFTGAVASAIDALDLGSTEPRRLAGLKKRLHRAVAAALGAS